MNLDAHAGEHRLFLNFAPSPDDEAYARQNGLLAGEEAAFAERDLLRVDLFPSGGTFAGEAVPPDEIRAAAERCGVGMDRFRAVLVGKDGGVKDRSSEPVAPAALYARIDAMPMRRREMRERGYQRGRGDGGAR